MVSFRSHKDTNHFLVCSNYPTSKTIKLDFINARKCTTVDNNLFDSNLTSDFNNRKNCSYDETITSAIVAIVTTKTS